MDYDEINEMPNDIYEQQISKVNNQYKIIRDTKRVVYRTITVRTDFLVFDSKLSLSAKGMLALILCLGELQTFTISELAKYTNESQYAISISLKELQDRGYIEKIIHHPIKGKNNTRYYEYHIYETLGCARNKDDLTNYFSYQKNEMDNLIKNYNKKIDKKFTKYHTKKLQNDVQKIQKIDNQNSIKSEDNNEHNKDENWSSVFTQTPKKESQKIENQKIENPTLDRNELFETNPKTTPFDKPRTYTRAELEPDLTEWIQKENSNLKEEQKEFLLKNIKNESIDILTDSLVFKTLPKKDVLNITNREKHLLIEKRRLLICSIMDYLNAIADRHYKYTTTSSITLISRLLNQGYTFSDFCNVIDKKTKDWNLTDFAKFLRPETLFGNKFEGYLNAPARSRIYGTNRINEIDPTAHHKPPAALRDTQDFSKIHFDEIL